MSLPCGVGSWCSFGFQMPEAQVNLEGEADTVLRNGLLFRAGEYPDKEFALTEDELLAAVTEFEPVPVDLEHTDTVLSGKLGELRNVEAKGGELHGTVALPGWLNNLVGSDPLKVSCAWDRATKRLKALSLVLNPRVTDAAVMSAFAEFAGKRHSAADMEALQKIHDLTSDQGAECKTGEARMSIVERLKKLLKTDGAADEELAKVDAIFSDPAPDPRIKQLEDQIAAFKSDAAQAQAKSDAEKFVLTARPRIKPVEEPALFALYQQALMDDAAAAAVVTFGADKDGKPVTGSRADALKALIEARPVDPMRQEMVPASFSLLPAAQERPDPNAVSDERKAQLAALAGVKTNGKGA